ncbi:MAG: imidazole glycerol phosphate synthase subunit HisH [Saprospiraceae bacterium]|nr:imidazole glycerol phosphate synthase subunit HisH [Saprospiraceae bacterium]MDZ4702788.1 imidazole glycerol phosphate synthase subunit HisH [Saprospiraceae bacterium]
MDIAVIDYNAGNVRSVLYALERLGIAATLTADPKRIAAADKVIFPGVGEAAGTMRHLRERGLDEVIKGLTQPVLGICLGMQLLCAHSEEGDTTCLGLIPQQVLRFRPQAGEKVPHMGWNTINHLKSALFSPELEDQYVYFVHSYYVEPGPYTIAITDYVQPFSAAVQKDNFYATQFHPEKSAQAGALILKYFIDL